MEDFILDILTTLGMGVNGNISSYSSDKATELFPNYKFTKKPMNMMCVENKTTGVFFYIMFSTNDKGYIQSFHIANIAPPEK